MKRQLFRSLLRALLALATMAATEAVAQPMLHPDNPVTVKRGQAFGLPNRPAGEIATLRLCPAALGCPTTPGSPPPAAIIGRRAAETTWIFLIPQRQPIGSYVAHLIVGPKEEVVGGVRVVAASPVVASPRTAAWGAAAASGAAVLIGLLVVTWLMGLRLGRRDGTAGTMQNGSALGPFAALLVDRGSSSYSLTALQFLVWTFTAVGVYAYVWALRYLVWGDLALPEVANGLVQVLGIGTGTGVVSAALNAFGSGKGNGDFHPSRSDFITSGGNLAPERLQQFIWLWIGALGYLATTFGANPADLVVAPELPESILTLSGLSAAGFLAGKLGRGPGPVIAGAVVIGSVPPVPPPAEEGSKAADAQPGGDPPDGSIKLALSGANLSPAATFLLAGNDSKDTNKGTFLTPVQVLAKPEASVIPAGGTLATQLTVTLSGKGKFSFAKGRWYSLTIVNPDGERSGWEFQC